MSRQKLVLPETFAFSAHIPVRITDLNYGNHVGNDSILSLIHEARVQFLRHHGSSELDFWGAALIMRDVTIEFKQELFYGNELQVGVAVSDLAAAGFDLYYRLQGENRTYAVARTGMVTFDYTTRKVRPLPEEALKRFS